MPLLDVRHIATPLAARYVRALAVIAAGGDALLPAVAPASAVKHRFDACRFRVAGCNDNHVIRRHAASSPPTTCTACSAKRIFSLHAAERLGDQCDRRASE